MPSFMNNVVSEPVTLVTSGDPKEPAFEPPQRPSHEKSSIRSGSAVDLSPSPLSNGSAPENGKGHISGKNVVSGGPYVINAPLSSVANGRSSTSSFSASNAMQEPGHGNPATPAQQKNKDIQMNQAGLARKSASPARDRVIDAAAPPSPDRHAPGRSVPSPTIQTRHRRAQSASNPASSPVAAGFDPSKLDPNRLSSPAVYDSSASNSAITTGANPYHGPSKLQHRHTLEVPKVNTARGSRDLALNRSNPSEDAITSSPVSGVRRGSLNLVRRVSRSVHSDMYLDELAQDPEATKSGDTMRQKRASRRKRKEEEEDDRVMVGKKVDESHVNWVTAYDMLTGIRFTVSRTNAKMDRELTDADFTTAHKLSFDVTGNELTPSAKYDFKFKDYAPWVFRRLRSMFHLDPADYLVSLTSKVILSELGSPGKSGSFFYFSRDYKYIIKTIHHAEHKLLRKILKDYYAHIEQNPNTLISQFYGLHRIKIPYGRKVHFVVMNNLFPPHRDIHQTFDLKGSTIGRDFKEEELEKNPRATLKDLNWLRRNYHLELGPIKKKMFIEQMTRDVALLKKLHIMDYSLLVGIHDCSKGNEENLRDKTLQVFQPEGAIPDEPQPGGLNRTPSKIENQRKARELRQALHREKPVPMDKSTFQMPDLETRKSRQYFYADDGGFQATHDNNTDGEEVYYLGIIDCLTHYGFVKRLENFWKGMQANKTQISPVPPENYGDRFVKFISGVTMPREEADRLAAERGNNPAQSFDGHGSQRGSQILPRTSSDDDVVERASREARKSERRGSKEGFPDRTLTAARSPSAERTGGAGGITLPILEEVGESGSTGGRSGRSGRSRSTRSHASRNRSRERNEYESIPNPVNNAPPLGGRPPPTPPKDAPNGLAVAGGNLGERNESTRDEKALPTIPTPRFSGTPLTFLPEGMK